MSMKKRKLAWLLAASMTLTSLSGVGLTGYAEEEPLILDEVEGEETEAVDVSEGVVPENAESELEPADVEEADGSFESEEQVEEAGTDVFIESVEEVDGIATQSAEVVDDAEDGFVIEQHWKEQKVAKGKKVLLQTNVRKNKGVKLLYQWYIRDAYRWEQISGVTGEDYLFENSGGFEILKCVVTNAANSKTDTIWFDINEDYNSTESITVEDYTEEIYVRPDETAQLSVTASSEKGPLEYKWYENQFNTIGALVATTASFTTEAGNMDYVCEISDGYSESYVNCRVHVRSGYTINDEDETIEASVGDRVQLSVNVETDGFREISYQWYKCKCTEEKDDDEEIAGATSAQYTTDPLGTDGSYRYECVVSDGYGDYCAYRTINTAYSITVDKESEEIYAKPNRAVTLSAKASTGKGKLTYQWVRRQWTGEEEIIGTSPDLTISNPQPGETNYICYIANGYTKTEVYRSVICDNFDFEVEGGCTKYIRQGESTELKVIVSPENVDLAYNWYWYEDQDEVSLGTGKSICVNTPGEYYCEVSDGVSSKVVPYLVKTEDEFQLFSEGEDIRVPYGKCADLKVEAFATSGELEYSWYKNGEYVYSQAEATLRTDPIVKKGQYDEYVCEVRNWIDPGEYEEKGRVVFHVGMENGDESTEKTVGLSVETPKRVWVAYGGSATLSVNAKTEDADNLTYKWYRTTYENLKEEADYNREAIFLSKNKTLPIYNVKEVRRYVCIVSDGITEQKVKFLVGPQEKMGLYAEDEEYAKLLPTNGAGKGVSAGWCGDVYFKFIPDQSGLWTFSFKRNYRIEATIYDESGKTVASFREFDELDDTSIPLQELKSLTPELQAGKIYFIKCDWCDHSDIVSDNTNITVYNKYIGNETHTHTWNSGIITKQPTCVTPGVKTYTCSGCQKIRTEEIPATGAHTMMTVTDRAATCGTEGSQHRECTVCHLKEASTGIPATGAHTMMTVTDRAATCGTEGSQHRECTVCHLKEAGVSISATGAHRYGAYTVAQQPTVLAAGIQVRTCGVCGRTESASIPKLTGTMALKASTLPLQLKKTVELKTIVTGLMAGDSIASCSSNNTKVATVSPTGKVTAKKAGKATITITLASGVSQSVTVKVQKGAVKTSKISGVASKVTLEAGKSLALNPVITPVTTKDKLSYSSSNKKVAAVSKSGVITSKASGKAKITIKSGSKKFVVTVTVPKKAPTGMQGVPVTKSLKKGKSFTIKTKLLPAGAEAKITYKSSNKKIATVNAKGKVIAKKAGTAVITVSAGGIKQTCTVTVK